MPVALNCDTIALNRIPSGHGTRCHVPLDCGYALPRPCDAIDARNGAVSPRPRLGSSIGCTVPGHSTNARSLRIHDAAILLSHATLCHNDVQKLVQLHEIVRHWTATESTRNVQPVYQRMATQRRCKVMMLKQKKKSPRMASNAGDRNAAIPEESSALDT